MSIAAFRRIWLFDASCDVAATLFLGCGVQFGHYTGLWRSSWHQVMLLEPKTFIPPISNWICC